MIDKYETEQEQFWAGEFGDEYSKRNMSEQLLASNYALFSKIFSSTQDVKSVIEFGANVGLNLNAISMLKPDVDLAAVEINRSAVEQLKKNNKIKVYNESLLNYKPSEKWDFVLIKGVLIHINPDELEKVYELLVSSSNRFICIAEYYNPSPVTVSYRGHEERLYKRDFAGELLDKFSELSLIDYGFIYHKDANFPQDDITWFLLKKNN